MVCARRLRVAGCSQQLVAAFCGGVLRLWCEHGSLDLGMVQPLHNYSWFQNVCKFVGCSRFTCHLIACVSYCRYEDDNLPSVDWVLDIARAAVYRCARSGSVPGQLGGSLKGFRGGGRPPGLVVRAPARATAGPGAAGHVGRGLLHKRACPLSPSLTAPSLSAARSAGTTLYTPTWMYTETKRTSLLHTPPAHPPTLPPGTASGGW